MLETVIIGRIGKDPEIKYFESGKCKTTFSIAVGRWDGKKKEEITDWFNVECWEKLAETISEHFKKGKQVIVQGEFKRNDYTNSSGEDKTKWTINAKSVKYSNAFLTITGEIERIEERFTSNNKKIQLIKVKDCEIPIHNFNNVELSHGEQKTFLCTLGMNEYKPFATALKIDVSKQIKGDVKFAEEEITKEQSQINKVDKLIDDIYEEENIPF